MTNRCAASCRWLLLGRARSTVCCADPHRATDRAYSLQATADNARCLRHERNDSTANPSHHGPCAAACLSYIAHQRQFIIFATGMAAQVDDPARQISIKHDDDASGWWIVDGNGRVLAGGFETNRAAWAWINARGGSFSAWVRLARAAIGL
jgi:hypothetical protein